MSAPAITARAHWLDRARPLDWRLPAVPGLRLWVVDLLTDVDDALLQAAEDTLSPAERQRAARLRFERDRRRYRVSHAVLHALLDAHVGPQARRGWVEGSHGKPALADSPWHFNLSHSADLALIGLCPDTAIGVDIEVRLPLDDADALAQRNFTASECAALRAAAPAERLHAFYRCWTRKEACLKAVGSGLSIEPHVFEAGVHDAPARTALHFDGRDWPLAVWSVPVPQDALAAVSLVIPAAQGCPIGTP